MSSTSIITKNDITFTIFLTAATAVWMISILFIGIESISQASDHTTALLGRDFVNIWSAGKLVISDNLNIIYNISEYHSAQETLFSKQFDLHNFSYPPHFIIFTVPFALVTYPAAYALWLFVTFGLFLTSLYGLTKSPWIQMLAVTLAPAVILNATTGQNGFLSAALFIGALRLLKEKPVIAGILLGLLTYKPHLGILIPFALIAGGYWRTFAAASITTLTLILISICLFGTELWISFLTETTAYQRGLIEYGEGLFTYMMPSAFIALRFLDSPLWLNYTVSGILAALSLVTVILVWRNKKLPCELQWAVLLTAAVLATPYVFGYDLTLLVGAILIGISYTKTALDRYVLLLAWLLPLLTLLLNAKGIVLGPFILLALLGYFLRLAKQETSNATSAPGH